MPSFVQLFRAAKGVWLNEDATEGAVVGENLFIRMDDGSLALFQPDTGAVVGGDGISTQVRLGNPGVASRSLSRSGRTVSSGGGSVATSNRFAATLRRSLGFALPGSNSGYLPASSPATPRSGFDLDPLMIAGLPGALDPYPSVPDTAHGFAVGTIVRLNGTDYVKSQANNAVNGEVVGMVAGIDDANHFRICPGGRVTGLPAGLGLVAGSVYFLSPTTAGAMTLVEPSALGQVTKPVFIADGPTSGYFINMRGQVIGGAPVTAARPAFMAGINSATDATVATGGTVPFNLTSFDTTGMFNPATGIATAVTAGNYELGFTIYFTNSASSTNQMHVGAYKNGAAATVGADTPMWLTATPNSMGGVICMSCVGLVMAVAGDTFKIVNTAAGNLRHYQGHSAFWMRYIDP